MDQSANGVFVENLFGDGALVKEGPGSLTLNSANEFSLSANVQEGSLIASTGSLPGTVSTASGTNVTFNQSSNGTYAGVISGSGKVRKRGLGVITLSGPNTYTGGTDIFDGSTLRGTTSSLQGAVTLFEDSNVAVDQDVSGTLTSSISGTGSVVKSGSGRVLLGGANTYSGSLNVLEGIAAGDTTSIQQPVNVAAGAAVEFAFSSGSRTLSESVSGSGKLIKSGGGTLNIALATANAGGVDVVGGALNLTGSLSGPISVVGSGTLTGTGEVDDQLVIGPGGTLTGQLDIAGHVSNSGRFAPDFVPGRTTLVNGYTQTPNGQLDVQLTGTQSEQRVTIAGEADLGGTLRIDASQLGTLADGDVFPILLADSLATNSAGRISTFDSLEVVGLANELPPLNLNYSNNSGIFGSVVAEAGIPIEAFDLPGDANRNQMIDDEDIAAMAIALYDPSAEITFSTGFQIFDLVYTYDIAGRDVGMNDGRIDFDDLATFAELISPSTGSLEASHALIADAIERVSQQAAVPELSAFHMLLTCLLIRGTCPRVLGTVRLRNQSY